MIVAIILIISKSTEPEINYISRLEAEAACYINREECEKSFVELKKEIQNYIAKNEAQNPDESIKAAFILANLYASGKKSPERAIEILEQTLEYNVTDKYKMELYVTLSDYCQQAGKYEDEKKYLSKALELNIDPSEYGNIDNNALKQLKKRYEKLDEGQPNE